MLANRLKSVMSSIISPEQTCCVPGRDIADNIMSVRDVIDFIDVSNQEGCGFFFNLFISSPFFTIKITHVKG